MDFRSLLAHCYFSQREKIEGKEAIFLRGTEPRYAPSPMRLFLGTLPVLLTRSSMMTAEASN
jgi:hypothetical protein